MSNLTSVEAKDVSRAIAHGLEKLGVNQPKLFEAIASHVMDDANDYTNKTGILAEIRRVFGEAK